MTRTHTFFFVLLSAVILGETSTGMSHAQQDFAPKELRVQRTPRGIYFHVRFHAPKDLYRAKLDRGLFWSVENGERLQHLPRLIPQDSHVKAVYAQLKYFEDPEEANKPLKERKKHIEGLEFIGKVTQTEKCKFVFLYPVGKKDPKEKDKQLLDSWKSATLQLDFSKATKVFPPERPGPRTPDLPLARDDLEGLWAYAQALYFAQLEMHSHGHGFFGFARAATSRTYGVSTARFGTPRIPGNLLDRQLYDLATGSEAITEALQLRRMLRPTAPGERTIDIATVPGIDLPEVDWKELLKNKKPVVEPLAKMVPHDNYYVRFGDFAKLIDFLDLAEKWGAPLLWAFEPHHREYELRQRYERQLCLPSKELVKKLGPKVLKALAISGSDLHLRDGSDVTVIFQARDRKLLLATLDSCVQQARRDFGDLGKQLRATRSEYHAAVIESYVTPLRQVSLHRAVLGDFVICSNSLVALRRVLDVQQGWRRSLAASQDFRYMRTVFPFHEKEDGFLVISDAFLRHIGGPANRIKAKRRLEALTSLAVATHAALFTAWDKGQLPADHKSLMTAAKLTPRDITTSNGDSVHWDGKRRLAVSKAFGTLHFATPLIEQPITKVTRDEQQAYSEFRRAYHRQWRGELDPIGLRIRVCPDEVRVKAHMLPMTQDHRYVWLRRVTGGGVAALQPDAFSKRTLVQFMTHVSPQANERDQLNIALRYLGLLGKGSMESWLGEWALVRFDDSPAYKKILTRWRFRGTLFDTTGNWDSLRETTREVFQTPMVAAIHIKNPLAFSGFLAGVKKTVNDILPGSISWETLGQPHKGIAIVRVKAVPDAALERWFNQGKKEKERMTPALYYTLLDDGWYVSTSKASLMDVIEQWVARKKIPAAKRKVVHVHGSLYVAPSAAVKAKEFLRSYFAWDIHQRTLANIPLWHTLYRTGLITDKMPASKRQAIAQHYFGYVPSSPDATAYQFQAKTQETVNLRHGSLRQPQQQSVIADDSPLARLLEEIQHLRADLLFEGDGLETTLVLQRRVRK